ncbi:Protein NRT1/ PTR FAMILY 5.6 [Glycine soja]
MSFFNWWSCGLCSGFILGSTVIVYVQDHVNWGVADIILSVVMAVSLLIFLIGRKGPITRTMSKRLQEDWARVAEECPRVLMNLRTHLLLEVASPLSLPFSIPLSFIFQEAKESFDEEDPRPTSSNGACIIVAAISKRKLPYPSDPTQLYEVSKSKGNRERFLPQTMKLKFLEKAAILENEGNLAEKQNPWKLTTVTKVEELKLTINMFPIWVFTLPFGICTAQTATFFIKQSAIMNRKIGNKRFEIPPASIFTLTSIGMIIFQ